MQTVISSRMMDAVEKLCAEGKRAGFPCTVLVGGTRQPGLLGPRVWGSQTDVQVIVDGKRRVLPMGAVSVDAPVLMQLAPVMSELDAKRRERELTETDIINGLLLRHYHARRRPSGRYAGHSCEPAGRR